MLLRRWIEREHLNHGSMYRLETGNHLRQVPTPCNPFITIAAIEWYARQLLTLLRWFAEKKEKDSCCFSEPNLRFILIWVAGAKLRTPNYHFLDGCRLRKLLSARIRCFTTILRCHDMAVSIFYTLQIQELTWPMCDRLWDNKRFFNYGANSKSPNCTIALKHSINSGPPWTRGILTAQVTPLQTCQSPWQGTDTINYTNYVWPSQTPSGSSDNRDSHISTMHNFSVPDKCSNMIFSRDWLPEIWNVMNYLPEPEVHQHNLDGDPMCGQLCRMTYWCGNETSFHNLTPNPTANEKKPRVCLTVLHSFMLNPSSFSTQHVELNRSHFSVTPIPEMIPARRNYANFGWATPSAVQLNSAYRDPVPWLDLKDAHFYKAGNHYILHHLDYYLMRKNKQITEDYLPKQMKFWKDMEDTMNQLESELTVYTRLLPAENSLGIPTRALFNKVLANMEALKDRREASQDFLPRKLLSDQHHPIYLVNRLLEEVKPPPPFIPTLTRRHSFSWLLCHEKIVSVCCVETLCGVGLSPEPSCRLRKNIVSASAQYSTYHCFHVIMQHV